MPRKANPHQAEALRRSLEREAYALFMEERTRKTKPIVDTAAEHARRGSITGAIIIGWPNGVQFTWATEWPLDWPEEMPYKLVVWRSGGMGTVDKRGQFSKPDLSDLLNFEGFSVLAMNCEAIITDLGYRFIQRLLSKRRCLVVADESSWLKSPGSARTKRMLAIGKHPNAVLRRILDGTPAAEGSLDLWAPCSFLDWRLLGHQSFFTFRNRYAVMTDGYGAGGRQFRTQATDAEGRKLYQNLEELRAKLTKFSFRVQRTQVSDIPLPEYNTVYFELTPRQRRVYNKLETEYEADLKAGTLPVSLAITRLLRLQMISRNYYPPETIGAVCPVCGGENPECPRCEGLGLVPDRTELERIDEHNPALRALVDKAEMHAGEQLIVWCRFRQDCDDVVNALTDAGRAVGRYDGTVHIAKREEAYRAFINKDLDAIVGTTSSGLTRGHDLSVADRMIYYSNSYVLRDRLQSQSRTESLDRRVATEVTDLIGVGTRDLPIVQALRNKRSVAEIIQGDKLTRWL